MSGESAPQAFEEFLMGYPCAFEGCNKRATRWEKLAHDFNPVFTEPVDVKVRPFCGSHYGEDECPNHIASNADPKICGCCGIHIDSLRPE